MFEKYQNFNAEDFATDDFFREWVFAKGSDANIFWTRWVKAHPGKREEVIQAIMLPAVRISFFLLPKAIFPSAYR